MNPGVYVVLWRCLPALHQRKNQQLACVHSGTTAVPKSQEELNTYAHKQHTWDQGKLLKMAGCTSCTSQCAESVCDNFVLKYSFTFFAIVSFCCCLSPRTSTLTHLYINYISAVDLLFVQLPRLNAANVVPVPCFVFSRSPSHQLHSPHPAIPPGQSNTLCQALCDPTKMLIASNQLSKRLYRRSSRISIVSLLFFRVVCFQLTPLPWSALSRPLESTGPCPSNSAGWWKLKPLETYDLVKWGLKHIPKRNGTNIN